MDEYVLVKLCLLGGYNLKTENRKCNNTCPGVIIKYTALLVAFKWYFLIAKTLLGVVVIWGGWGYLEVFGVIFFIRAIPLEMTVFLLTSH